MHLPVAGDKGSGHQPVNPVRRTRVYSNVILYQKKPFRVNIKIEASGRPQTDRSPVIEPLTRSGLCRAARANRAVAERPTRGRQVSSIDSGRQALRAKPEAMEMISPHVSYAIRSDQRERIRCGPAFRRGLVKDGHEKAHKKGARRSNMNGDIFRRRATKSCDATTRGRGGPAADFDCFTVELFLSGYTPCSPPSLRCRLLFAMHVATNGSVFPADTKRRLKKLLGDALRCIACVAAPGIQPAGVPNAART